ncbi:MAG: carbon starvation protein A [Candidatus Hydrogenedentes bacterium]|nr:carbon starvation protein A [Candidatus Hydrogenedentota bacterium]
MILAITLIAGIVFLIAYFTYGGYLSKKFNLDKRAKTPAEELYDGIDYCPAHPAVLLGHHFASIAGAGPIVGPIAAGGLFGWLPVYLWVVVGSVFAGGVHDFGSIVASVRHKGLSIGEVVGNWVSERAKILFLCFTWLALILVIAVFLQLSADTFAQDSAVAFSGTLYIFLALIFGLVVYRFQFSLLYSSLVAIPIVLLAVYFGKNEIIQRSFSLSMESWRIILSIYILLASVLPVWLLLQPRDYLASFLLYFSVIVGAIGILLGGASFEVKLPVFTTFFPDKLTYLWPVLFVTVACGAVSGFHCMVASGTTSKQLRCETDAKVIGYGGMLLEGFVAIVALSCVMLAGSVPKEGPLVVFGEGFAKFAGLLNINPDLGKSMGLLAVNSFILTTLDTATRLARYQLQELSRMRMDRFTATIISVACALALVYFRTGNEPAWKLIWPIFGASNQLVAGIALLGIMVWVAKGLKKGYLFVMIPMVFMIVTTIGALSILGYSNFISHRYLLVFISATLAFLALLLIYEVAKVFRKVGRS